MRVLLWADGGDEQIKSLCSLLLVSGRALVRGPSSLMKKAELSEDQSPDALMEESSTSLAPTILYLTTFEAPATEESLILPVTSLWPQVRGWKGPWDDLMQTLPSTFRETEAQGQEGDGPGPRGWMEAGSPDAHPAQLRPAGPLSRECCHCPGSGPGAHSMECQGIKCQLSTLVSEPRKVRLWGKNFVHPAKGRE